MIPRTLRLFPWFLLTLILLAGGCGGGGGGGATGGGTANVAPTLTAIGNQVVVVGNSVSFTVTANDPNLKDTVLLFASGLPQGATFTAANGRFTWTPSASQLGDHSITFVASDGFLEATETIIISVRNNSNTAPVLTLTTEAATITENQPLTVTANASDADADPVTLSVSELPAGASFNPTTGLFSWTPQLVTPGTLSVIFTASDNFASVSKTLTITYNRTNPLLATDSTVRGITIFPQTTPVLDGFSELFPGQANFWDLDRDIAQVDGFWNQFQGNMLLAVQTTEIPLTEALFPNTQTFVELTFMTPLLSALDGLRVAAVADHTNYTGPDSVIDILPDLDEGNASAWLNATADSRLEQILDLRQASGVLTLSWKDEFLAQAGDFPGATPHYRVVTTDQTTGARTILFAGTLTTRNVIETTPSRQRVTRTADLSALVGKKVLLSFELRGAHQLLRDSVGDVEFIGSYARIDNVSVRDGSANEFVINGGFENDITGWTANAGLQSQNLRSAARNVNGLSVTRHFYTPPNQLWARWTDVLVNNTAAPVTRRVVLRTFLGSAGFGIIYPDGSNRSLTSWDGTTLDLANNIIPDRDIGLVFGTATSNSFTSSSALNTADGNDIIEMAHDVTIPAGGQISLVHFALMSGDNTGETAVNITARATLIDTEINNILSNFRTNPRYRDGMTQAQIDTLQNF